jgi:hypothetical protein
MLHDEKIRAQECRKSQNRLEEKFGQCQREEQNLKQQLGTCSDEREELKCELERAIFFQFTGVVSNLGTGGYIRSSPLVWLYSDDF